MIFISHINQSIIASKSIRIDGRFSRNLVFRYRKMIFSIAVFHPDYRDVYTLSCLLIMPNTIVLQLDPRPLLTVHFEL